MDGPTPDLDHENGNSDGLAMRHVWAAGAVGAVVLAVLVAVAVAVTSGGGGSDERAAAAPSPPTTAAPSPPATSAAPATTRPTAGPSTSAAPARTVWSGTVRLTDAGSARDLDTVPPRSADGDRADIRGTWLHPGVGAEAGAQLAEAEPKTRPGARACRDIAAAAGVDEVKPVKVGDVLCVVTAAGRVGRLTVTAARQVQSQPSLTLDVVLWDGD